MEKPLTVLRGIGWVFCLILFAGVANAQDLVGVLPELQNPELADRLKLTSEQRDQLGKLITSRISAAVGLSQELREVPPDQRLQRRRDFNTESERLGFELLTAEQRVIAEKIRVNRLGMLSLDESKVSQALNLADWQKAKVAEWSRKILAADRRQRDEVRKSADVGLRAELSESQLAAWQVLAGQAKSSAFGAPKPPQRVTEALAANVAAKSNAVAPASSSASAAKKMIPSTT